MKKFNIDQVENTGITIDTIKGLAEAINDLVDDDISIFTTYPSSDSNACYRANRLGIKLLALSNAAIDTADKAKKQINQAIKNYLESGEKQCN